jgi:hypothetical protein
VDFARQAMPSATLKIVLRFGGVTASPLVYFPARLKGEKNNFRERI